MKIMKLKYIFSSSHPIFKSDNKVSKTDAGDSLFKLNNKRTAYETERNLNTINLLKHKADVCCFTSVI